MTNWTSGPLTIITCATVCAASLSAEASPQAPPGQELRESVVVTTGEGLLRAPADRAFVTLAVETRAPTPRAAQQQNSSAMSAVQQRLTDAHVPREAVRTLGYDLHLEFDYANGKQVPRAYVARNSIDVRLDDIARVGDVLEVAVGAGATTVSGIRFEVKDRDRLEREALKQAVADARARAEAAASGAGRSIDRVLRIEETRESFVPLPIRQSLRVAAESPAPQVPVSPGELELRAHVTLTAVLR